MLTPQAAEQLGEQLAALARRYIYARRRSGEALLEAARWLYEARQLAAEGTWYTFLEVTGTSRDLAERLLNTHLMAQRSPRFAEAVTRGQLNPSVAALLARPSTPPTVVETILETASAPRVQEVRQAIRAAQSHASPAHVESVDSPQNTGYPHDPAAAAATEAEQAHVQTLAASDHALIAQLTSRLEGLLAETGQLSGADVQALARLYERLGELLQRTAAS
jgi:hypothetical protein